MYESFFGLRERPFELGSDLRFLFLPPGHREALSNLQYGIASRKGVTVLTGEVGTGKTTLVRAAIAQADPSALCVHMTNPRLNRAEFFEFLSSGYKLGARTAESKVVCMTALEERLVERLNRREYSTLIVDEVQAVSDEVLEEIRLLTNMELSDGSRLLSIVLVGQPEFAERLNSAALRHLRQRVALRCELRPFHLQETAGFISNRIRVAGGVAPRVFTREAVQTIHEASGGIARVISVLCDNALVTGFATGERPVDRQTVLGVCADFHLSTAGVTAPAVSAVPRETAPAPVAPSPVAEPARVPAVAAEPLPHAAEPQEKTAAVATPGERPMFNVAPRRRWFGVF